MRTLFLLLILANIAFFAWTRYASQPGASADAAPLARQIEPQKLRVLRPGELPAPSLKGASGQPVASAPLAAAAPLPAQAGSAQPAACLEWGSFTLTDAPKAEKALDPLALGSRLTQRRTEELAGWWVFIPPQPNRQAAVKKAAELKSLGVEEYFVVPDEGPYRWAVSLGVFRTQDAAQARLVALRALGVRSAQIGPRETLVPKVWLQVRDADAAVASRLQEIARQIEGSEVRPCS